MEQYIRLEEYPKRMKIQKGDAIFISSDVKIMLWDAKMNTGEFDLLLFIDSLKKAVGEDGTIIFPTYNWDFCQGKTFNYRTTPCRTGTLGALALKQDGFKRTKHPIYSFAVWGRHQDYLCSLTNKDSFGMDSPFAFFKKHNVKNYIIDVSLKNSFTYVHFVEQQSGLVNYRYLKNFQGNYIDEN